MTIGIAAAGPNAGLAVFMALRAVEGAGQGSIKGYASYAAVIPGDRVLRAETQRGGTRTLFVAAESTGTPPPPEMAEASVAGVMSSGPDRPEPLAQYVPAERSGVLVTGHRLPNAPAGSGRPLNREILKHLIAGESAQDAVTHVLQANAEADAGVIAIDREGRIFSANSARVARRSDLGAYVLEDDAHGARAAALCNAVRPPGALARLAVEVALDVMVSSRQSLGRVVALAGTALEAGDDDAIHVDESGTIQRIITSDDRLLAGTWNCAPIYRGGAVYRDDRLLGHVIEEANAVVIDGVVARLNGSERIELSYALAD